MHSATTGLRVKAEHVYHFAEIQGRNPAYAYFSSIAVN